MCHQPSQISNRSSTLNCDFSQTFQPTPFKLLLTRTSLCALSSAEGHWYQRQKMPKLLKIEPWPLCIWLLILSGVHHCDLRPINERAKCCRVFWEVVIWFRERNSSSTFRECTRFILFLTEWAAQRRLPTVVTFFLFLSKRFVSSWEFSRNDYNQHWAAYIVPSRA